MAYADQLTAEINAYLDRLADTGQPWRADWIANAICIQHEAGLVDNEHAFFWQHCARAEVRDQVRRCIGKRADPATDGDAGRCAQAALPGFDHLQTYYLVKRGDEEIGVPVGDLTDEEIDEKCALLRRMATTCFAHANELERFKIDRVGKGRAAGAA